MPLPATESQIPTARVGLRSSFSASGQVRPYKQLPELVRAFRAIPYDDVRLVIAGKPVIDAELERI
jgi:hypothetical protein